LTDEPAGPTVGNDYYLRFEKPITSLSLDLYDFRGDGGPQIGDTAILKIYADDNYKTLVGQAIYKIEGHETDQNVVRLKVKLDCVAARSARLAFSKPDDGTGIDNVTFETAIAATSPKAFGKLPQGVGPQPAVPARPLDAPLNHGLVASCYTANLRSPIDMRESAITPLMIAASAGDSPTLQRLIRAGANPNLRDSSAWTALTYSSVAERPAALEVLIAAGADPNALSITGQTAIMAAASANKPPSFLQPLIAAGANVNAQDADGFTALMLTGNRDAAELLLRAGADPNLRSSAGQTAMMLNAGPADASIDMLRLLVNSGADINAQDNLGQTALMLLVMRRSPAAGDTPLSEDGVDIKRLSAAVSLLKRAGARTDLRDASGRTVLDRLELEQQAVMRNLELVRSDLSGKSIRDARSNVAKWYEQLRETLAR
jgi:ankyrin repeat protein